MMNTYEISWTYGGYSTIVASSKTEAMLLFASRFNLTDYHDSHGDTVDVVSVEEVG